MIEWAYDNAEFFFNVRNYENLWIELRYWTAPLENTGWMSYEWNST